MLELNAKNTALVVIDLQEGILPFAGGPHRADEVVARAARLADKCRQQGSPVIMVRVGWSADFAEALKQPVDAQAGAHTLPENWWTYPAALGKHHLSSHGHSDRFFNSPQGREQHGQTGESLQHDQVGPAFNQSQGLFCKNLL